MKKDEATNMLSRELGLPTMDRLLSLPQTARGRRRFKKEVNVGRGESREEQKRKRESGGRAAVGRYTCGLGLGLEKGWWQWVAVAAGGTGRGLQWVAAAIQPLKVGTAGAVD